MSRKAVWTVLIAVMITAASCQSSTGSAGSAAAPQSTPELKQALSAGKKTVVFFLNPQGGPCRAQNDILVKLQQDKGGSFNVSYVSALQPENQQAFYDYGVRSLPTMVIVDSSGKIGRVFPPGIQDYQTLAAALDGTK